MLLFTPRLLKQTDDGCQADERIKSTQSHPLACVAPPLYSKRTYRSLSGTWAQLQVDTWACEHMGCLGAFSSSACSALLLWPDLTAGYK